MIALLVSPGVQIYRNFYSEEKERSNGVLAICVSKQTSQPYVIMASILSVSILCGLECLFHFHFMKKLSLHACFHVYEVEIIPLLNPSSKTFMVSLCFLILLVFLIPCAWYAFSLLGFTTFSWVTSEFVSFHDLQLQH